MSVKFSIAGKNPNCSILIASFTLIASVDSIKLVFVEPQTAPEKEWHHFEGGLVLYAAKAFWPAAVWHLILFTFIFRCRMAVGQICILFACLPFERRVISLK